MIELESVTKAYGTRHGIHVVLNDISAVFPSGESVGILGRNGAGKSTLMRVLGGAEAPDGGKVRRHGRISWPIGFAGGFHPSLSGEENCRFLARIYDADIDDVVAATEEFAELGEYFYNPIKTYSSGMRARLAFGVSMAIDFETYLVDEVTAVGDARFKKKSEDAFAARRGRSSIIIVSHQMSTIRQFADRCAVLEGGRLQMYDTLEEAERAYQAVMA